MDEDPTPDDVDETPADTAYRWTIRMLYLAAVGLNVWLLADYVRKSPDGQLALARLREQTVGRWEQAKARRKAEAHTVFEAIQVVEEAGNHE